MSGFNSFRSLLTSRVNVKCTRVLARRVLARCSQCVEKRSYSSGSPWQRYVSFIDRYGWKAQCINTCVLVGLGDVLSQYIVYKRNTLETFDFGECLRYFGVGLTLLGPTMHLWYTGLDKFITMSGLRAAILKMLLDQTIYLPLYVCGIIVVMAVLTRETKSNISNNLSRDFPPIMLYCYMGWPWIQIINFRYVPLKHRILVMNMVGLFYNTLTAWKVEQNRSRENSD